MPSTSSFLWFADKMELPLTKTERPKTCLNVKCGAVCALIYIYMVDYVDVVIMSQCY